MNNIPFEDLIDKTVILIAAAGDASRVMLPEIRQRLLDQGKTGEVLPLWLQEYCLPTWRLPQMGLTFLDSQLMFIHNSLGANFPVAIITGPNTDSAIVCHLEKNEQYGLTNLCVIQQESNSVFTAEGRLVFWEDGKDLRAPNGTAGCIQALLENEWFQEQGHEGRDFVYLWYGNDFTAGRHIRSHLDQYAACHSPSTWLSGPPGYGLVEKVVRARDARQRTPLIHALEDSSGAYIFHREMGWNMVNLADPHVVERNIPVINPDGSFLRGYKCELFLCDSVWKIQSSGEQPNTGFQLQAPCQSNRTPSRLDRFMQPFDREQLLQNLKTGQGIETKHDLGDKRVGDNLVDDWRIEALIEKGIGIVYICQDVDDQEKVAVKTYRDADRWFNPLVRNRYRQEALAWVGLEPHPNLVEARSIREIDGAVHIFMEFAPGGDLRNRLQCGPLPLPSALEIGIQVCEALQVIHRHGILHKDLKPENVLFDEQGHAKLGDFGLAASLYGDNLKEVAGTIFYMAPELIGQGQVGKTADLYSLGVLLYEMLSGVLPFLGTLDEIERQHLSVPPVPLTERDASLDANLERVVLACLAKDPAARPQSAQELENQLKQCYRRLCRRDYPTQKPSIPGLAEAVRINRKRLHAFQVLGQYEQAFAVTAALLRQYPDETDILMDQANLLFSADRFSDCSRTCLGLMSSQSAAESFDLARANLLLEMCAVFLGKQEEIIEAHTQWIFLATAAWIVQGDACTALKIVELCIKVDPENSPAWMLKGQLFYELGDFSGARDVLEKCLTMNFWLFQPGQYENSIRLLRNCQVLLNPELNPAFTKTLLAVAGGDSVEIERSARELLTRMPDSVWTLNILGTALEQQGGYAEAISCFERVLEAAPAHPHAHFTKGLAMYKSGGDPKECLDEFEFASMMEPGDERALNMVGECYRRVGDGAKAIECFQRSLGINPRSIVALMALSMMLAKEGEIEKAIQYVNQAVQFYPSDPEAWEIRGDVLAIAGQATESLDSWKQALLTGGANPRLFNKLSTSLGVGQPAQPAVENATLSADEMVNRGIRCKFEGKNEEALEHFNQAIQLDPINAKAFSNRASIYLAQAKLDMALADLRQAVAIDPDLSEAYINRGSVFAMQGRLSEAIEEYNHGLNLDPGLWLGYFGRGSLYQQMGNAPQALDNFTRAAQLNPEHPLCHFFRAEVFFSLKRYGEALDEYQSAIQLGYKDAPVYNSRGMAFNKLRMVREALEDFSTAVQLDPGYAEAHYNHGNTCFALGRYSEALADYTRSIQLDPTIVLAYNNRGNTYNKLARPQEALADYKQALRLDPNLTIAYGNIAIMSANANQLEEAVSNFEKAALLGDQSAVQATVVLREKLARQNKGFFRRLFGKK